MTIAESFGYDIRLVRILYIVYVRPPIELAELVWSPMLKGDMNLLEKIQHRVTRMVPGLRKLPYSERLEKLSPATIEERRNKGDLIQTYKILNGIKKAGRNEWNRLPEEVISSKTIDEFKPRLDRHTIELSNGIRMRLL